MRPRTLHAAGRATGIRGARPARPEPWLLLLAVALFLAGRAELARAGEPNRAALAVVFEDGTRLTRCIEFEGDEITGSEMLARSGLATILDSTHGGGITVCQIEGTGCSYPVDPCFCRCMGNGPCRYWNYYYRQPGQAEWVYSPLGALIHKSAPGSVEAWVWGDGHTPPDSALTFESICAPSPTPSPTSAPDVAEIALTPLVAMPAPTSTPASAPGKLVTPASSPAASAQPAQETALATSPAPEGGPLLPGTSVPPVDTSSGSQGTPAPSSALGGWLSYWPFGLMLLALGAIALYLRASRRL